MRSPVRLLLLTLAVVMAAAGTAHAALIGPDLVLPTFTKAQAGGGNAVQATFNFTPTTFLPPTAADRQDIIANSLDGGVSTSASLGSTTNSVPLLLSNGHLYSVTVAGCQSNALCTSLGPASFLAVTATTRIDATPPTGTVQINGGAAFTNSRNVTLGLAASDPLIDGIAGSSSGVTQYAADIDNDGTFPCPIFVIGNQPTDRSGCAGPFGPSAPATLTDGDGPKTVGVRFGDGARNVVAPCTTIFCTIFLGNPILGNESATATDSIGLDTAKPLAIVTQDRFAVARGGTVVVNSASSVNPNPGSASGIDPTKTTWNFNDGTPVATGAKVSHAYSQVGTFVGELRVRDRAGNVSDPRSFAVTINAPAGATASGGGSVLGIQGTAAFTITRLKVRARYARSRLAGAIALSGTSTAAGPLRAQVRAIAGNRLLATIPLKALAVGGFSRTVKLPATLLPGSYRITLVGPGGTLASTLRLLPPREGVIRTGRIAGSRVSFTLAATPAKPLRARLTVRWSQGRRLLGTVPVVSGRTIRASLPAGASLGSGRLTAQLRAGSIVVGSATRRVR